MIFSRYLYSVVLLLVLAAAGSSTFARNAEYTFNVYYPGGLNVEGMLFESIDDVLAPDFLYRSFPIEADLWADPGVLVASIYKRQAEYKSDGIFLACKRDELDEVSRLLQAAQPKMPFVDVYAPALMAANVVSSRYYVLSGSPPACLPADACPPQQTINSLGIENHLLTGPALPGTYLVGYRDYPIDSSGEQPIKDIVQIGQKLVSSDDTANLVIGIETIALVGCAGFLDPSVAAAAQKQLDDLKIPLQVVHPVKAAVGLLQSMIRNRIWISVPEQE